MQYIKYFRLLYSPRLLFCQTTSLNVLTACYSFALLATWTRDSSPGSRRSAEAFQTKDPSVTNVKLKFNFMKWQRSGTSLFSGLQRRSAVERCDCGFSSGFSPLCCPAGQELWAAGGQVQRSAAAGGAVVYIYGQEQMKEDRS